MRKRLTSTGVLPPIAFVTCIAMEMFRAAIFGFAIESERTGCAGIGDNFPAGRGYMGIFGNGATGLGYPWEGIKLIHMPLLAIGVFGGRVAPTYWLGALLVTVGIIITHGGTSS